MNAKKKLLEVARSCSQAASMKLRADAQTLIALSEQLDDTSAAIYLERFCQKWGLDEAAALDRAPSSQVRRAPARAAEPAPRLAAPFGAEAVMLGEVMIDELEAQILAELDVQPRGEIEVRFEGLDEGAAWGR